MHVTDLPMQNVHDAGVSQEVESSRHNHSAARLVASESALQALYLAAGAAAIGLMFWYLQFSTRAVCCGDFDGYYHIKWSRLLWEGVTSGKFPPTFVWLPFTTLNPQDYVDHHFLFHILQIPFTWFGDLRMAAKVSAWLFASLAVFSCYWLMVRYRVRYPLLWLLALLACPADFYYRMNMSKAPSISIVFMVAGIFLLFERKYRWLAPLAFLYVWTYSMFVMLGVAAVVWTGVLWWSERRIEWRPILWITIGIALGFVINPYFPDNVRLFYEHALMKIKASDFTTRVGGEWYPYGSWEILQNCFVAFVAMFIGYVAFNPTDRRRVARPLFFLVFATVLLIITARSRRWIEYWPPFAVLFAAFSLQPYFDGVRRSLNPSSDTATSGTSAERLPPLDDSPEVVTHRWYKDWYQLTAVSVVTAALGTIIFFSAWWTAKDIRASAAPEQYRGATEWIRRNVPKGEMIFNTDWDDFPMLFFYDTDHRYASGLDPTYLLDKNPELSRAYEDVTLGREPNMAEIIRDRFGARYVFTDKTDDHNNFYRSAMESGWFEDVYLDEHCMVLRVMDEPSTKDTK